MGCKVVFLVLIVLALWTTGLLTPICVAQEQLGKTEEQASIEERIKRDRQDQEQTHYLKTKLEQTHLELEQEKALEEINKLRMENSGNLKESGMDTRKNILDMKLIYIGGGVENKEAILAIDGVDYHVTPKSFPLETVEILQITDTAVIARLGAPWNRTRVIEYR